MDGAPHGLESDLVLVRLEAADAAEVEALYNVVFSWKPVPPGYARWRFWDPAVPGACVGVRDKAGGRLVAAHGIQLLPATTTGTAFTLGLSVDVMVHPDWQRRGVGSWMDGEVARAATESGCAALACFPNPKLDSMRKRASEWELVMPSCAVVRRVVPGEARAMPASRGLPTAMGEALRIARSSAPAFTGVDRSLPYLDWRYVRHPFYAYEFVAGDEGNAPWVAVTKTWSDPRGGPPLGDIVDLVVPGARAAASVLDGVHRHLASRGAERVHAWLPPAWADQAAGAGFEQDPAGSRPFQVRRLSGGGQIPFDRWFLVQGDTDLY